MYDEMDDAETVASPGSSGRNRVALLVLALAATIAVVVGLIVWVASGGADDEIRSATPGSTGANGVTSTGATTSTPTTTPIPTTEPPGTTTAATAPPTSTPTSPPTTDAPGLVLPGPGAESWTVSSELIGERTLQLGATLSEIRVFDGSTDELRCVGVVGPAEQVTTWCGQENRAVRFIAHRGPEPIVVELGADVGDITIEPRTGDWTLGSNGCAAPMSEVLRGVDPGSLAVTAVVCSGAEAFLGIGSALFGPGVAPDGGGILAASDGEEWSIVDFGTSVACAELTDGVDRCESFGVEFELFEALLPIPPAATLGDTATDVTEVRNRTADIMTWIGATTDPDDIEALVTDQLVDPDAEIPAATRRADELHFGQRLLVVEIPQLDDSIRSETWAVWIGTSAATAGVTAFSWWTCERGLGDDGLCV